MSEHEYESLLRKLVHAAALAFAEANTKPERWRLTSQKMRDGIVARVALDADLVGALGAVLEEHCRHGGEKQGDSW